jgi:glutamate-1-semialdehyde 2,1-aminomutase
MDQLSPVGPVYQAGTLSGNPLAVAAGIACLTELSKKDTYRKLNALSDYFAEKMGAVLASAPVPTYTNRVGSMSTTFFAKGPVTDYATAKTADTALYGKYFHGLLERGVYVAPSQFEAGFVSIAHTPEVIAATIESARVSLRNLK